MEFSKLNLARESVAYLVRCTQEEANRATSLSVTLGQSLRSMDCKRGHLAAIAATAGGPSRMQSIACSWVKGNASSFFSLSFSFSSVALPRREVIPASLIRLHRERLSL